MTKPLIAITMGEPAGVGPELCLKLLTEPFIVDRCTPLIFGDADVLQDVSAKLSLPLPDQIVAHDTWQSATLNRPTIVDLQALKFDVQPGEVNRHTGAAAFHYIDSAIDAALRRDVAAIVTGPIHKEAFAMAGIPFPGHTELLAERTMAARVCMMLTSPEITCSLVTAHVGLKDVPRLLNTDAITDAIELSYDAMRRIRGREPQLSVCGLNPHAGENGLFGAGEEQQLILPAIESARKKKINIQGPLPPDTAFLPKYREQTDCYICMYHDQGLIPLKALAFDTAVNVTLGLPIVRTSVDHGTALDIAWQGKASVASFVAAVDLAIKLI